MKHVYRQEVVGKKKRETYSFDHRRHRRFSSPLPPPPPRPPLKLIN